MNILPWSSLWKSDYEPQGERMGDRHKTPLGGILLEFIMTIVHIALTAAIPGLLESVSLPGNIQTIAHCFILSRSLRLSPRLVTDFSSHPRSWSLPIAIPRTRFERHRETLLVSPCIGMGFN